MTHTKKSTIFKLNSVDESESEVEQAIHVAGNSLTNKCGGSRLQIGSVLVCMGAQ